MKKRPIRRTRSLSKYDLNVLLPIVREGLETKRGKENAVTANQIIAALRAHGLKIDSYSVKMLVHYIRRNDLIVGLMASSVGYYVGSCEQDLIGYEESLRRREESLRELRLSIQRQRVAAVIKTRQKHADLF